MQARTNTLRIDMAAINRAVFLTLFSLAVYLVIISPALAQIDTPMGDILCAIVAMIYGNLGRGLATLAVVVLGVGATLGKVSWGLAITVAVGIAVIFNAETIVQQLMGVSATICF